MSLAQWVQAPIVKATQCDKAVTKELQTHFPQHQPVHYALSPLGIWKLRICKKLGPGQPSAGWA